MLQHVATMLRTHVEYDGNTASRAMRSVFLCRQDADLDRSVPCQLSTSTYHIFSLKSNPTTTPSPTKPENACI
jgi:hypothetical protein